MECPFCYIHQKPGIISISNAIKFINAIQPRNIVFHGGEPLLYPESILDIIYGVKQNKYNFSITSNLSFQLSNKMQQVIDQCSIATSYSYDRFYLKKQQYNQFKENLYKISKNKDITLLITLSNDHMKNQKPEELQVIINTLPIKYVLLERMYGNYTPELANKTDEYMFDMFKLLDPKQNILYRMMVNAIKNHLPVFNTKCNSDVITLNTDGKVFSCPNLCGKRLNKNKKCLLCNLYEYCHGDCPSFQDKCMFPKKTFELVKRDINDQKISRIS